MHVQGDESIIKIVRRHPTPFIFRIVQAVIVLIPIYALLYLIAREFGTDVLIGALSIFSFFAVIGFVIGSLDYVLDRLVLTTHRVIWVDWKSLLKKEEHEMQLSDIQNVKTSEFGIISKIPFFKFGTLEIESAASQTSVLFKHCNDPLAIKHLMLAEVDREKKSLLDDQE